MINSKFVLFDSIAFIRYFDWSIKEEKLTLVLCFSQTISTLLSSSSQRETELLLLFLLLFGLIS